MSFRVRAAKIGDGDVSSTALIASRSGSVVVTRVVARGTHVMALLRLHNPGTVEASWPGHGPRQVHATLRADGCRIARAGSACSRCSSRGHRCRDRSSPCARQGSLPPTLASPNAAALIAGRESARYQPRSKPPLTGRLSGAYRRPCSPASGPPEFQTHPPLWTLPKLTQALFWQFRQCPRDGARLLSRPVSRPTYPRRAPSVRL